MSLLLYTGGVNEKLRLGLLLYTPVLWKNPRLGFSPVYVPP